MRQETFKTWLEVIICCVHAGAHNQLCVCVCVCVCVRERARCVYLRLCRRDKWRARARGSERESMCFIRGDQETVCCAYWRNETGGGGRLRPRGTLSRLNVTARLETPGPELPLPPPVKATSPPGRQASVLLPLSPEHVAHINYS